MARNCPRCQLPMRQELYEGVTVDACRECWGYWLDKGEFGRIADSKDFVFSDEERRKLLAWAQVEHAKRARGEAAPDPEIPCPVCKKPMEKVEMNVKVPIVLDRCTHGVWFDTRELKLAQVLAEKTGWIRDFFFEKLRE